MGKKSREGVGKREGEERESRNEEEKKKPE